MNVPHYDVAIVGLGPAGATLARLLAPSFAVLALDKKGAGASQNSAGFHKPCGGLLAPDAQKAMAGFGLALPLGVMVDPQVFSVNTIDLASGLTRHYQRYYSNLDRQAFDQWLVSLLPKSIEVRKEAHCTAVERIPAGFSLAWREKGKNCSATARYVVGADGAFSFVRKALYQEFCIRTYTAIQQWFINKHSSPFYSCIFDPDTTDCYAWGLTKNDFFIFGGAFAPKHARRSFDALKDKMQAYGFALGEPVKTEVCAVLRPSWPARLCSGNNGAFLVGEAAGLISPSSLEGLSYAFESAKKLAAILNTGNKISMCKTNSDKVNIGKQNPNKAYKLALLPLRIKLLVKIAKCPFIFSPLLRKLVMLSGIRSVPVLKK